MLGGCGVPGKLFERGHPLDFDPGTSSAVFVRYARRHSHAALSSKFDYSQGEVHGDDVQIAKGKFLD